MNGKIVYVLVVKSSERGQSSYSIDVEVFSTKEAGDKAFDLKVQTESKNLKEGSGRCRVEPWTGRLPGGEMRSTEITSRMWTVDVSLRPVLVKS